MLSVLMEVGIGRPLVDRRHRHRSLQLVQLRRAHRVELLTADQPVLRQRQQVVAPHAVGVRLRVEVGLQLRRQQIVEPGRLVTALFTDQHEDDVVNDTLVYPSCHHRHEPLLQEFVEEHLLLHAPSDGDGHRQFDDVVLPVPWRQVVEVVAEGVVFLYEVRLHHAVHVLRADGLHLRQLRPE